MEKEVILGKDSQERKLRKLVQQAFIAVATVVLMLIISIGTSFLLTKAEEEQISATMALNQYRLGSKTLTYSVQSYAVTAEQKYYDAYMRELNENRSREMALEVLSGLDVTSEEWDSLNHIAELSDGLVPLEKEAMQAAGNGDIETAIAAVFSDTYGDTVEEITAHTDEVIEQIQSRKSRECDMFSMIQAISDIMFITSIIYVACKIRTMVRFAKKELLEPIKKVSVQMADVAAGNFDKELDLKEDDSEVGTMVKSINFMKQNLQGIVGEISDVLEQMGEGDYQIELRQQYVGIFVQIKELFLKMGDKMRETLLTLRQVSEQIEHGSEQLACAAADLAEGSTTQAGKVSELVSVVEGMSKSIEQNAKEAENSVKIAQEAGVTLAAGNSKMQELKLAIEEISRCSEQISSINGTIEDIASQTNLLSLNAAIEAARAGEAGRGFAVVAEQVKNLAEESSKAAGRTTKLIEMAIEAVAKGISIADETALSIDGVMEGAKTATEKMGQIAHMLEDNVRSIHEINVSITEVSSVVDNNSATSQETAAVSEEQKAQVDTMVQLMDKFKL